MKAMITMMAMLAATMSAAVAQNVQTVEQANAVEASNARETAEPNRDRIISKLRPDKNGVESYGYVLPKANGSA